MISPAAIAALLSTGVISLAPNLILLLFPNYVAGQGGSGTSASSARFLSLGQAMAAGGLLGDVFLHTLPDAKAQGREEEAGLWVLLGFSIFFVADVVIRTVDARNQGSGHSHNHATQLDNKEEKQKAKPEHVVHATSMILLNMTADCLHNFTDGLAIGASYAAAHKDASSQSATLRSVLTSRGGLASMSILFHEVPHELGDFCSLIRAGYSKKQAIVAQFITAIAAFVGTVVALSVSEGWASDALLFVTAGGFVYLAATTILPEVLEDSPTSWWFRIAQIAAFGMGIGLLYIVSLLEEHEHHHHHHDHHSHAHDHAASASHGEL